MANALLIGGNRGIGLELARVLAGRSQHVLVTCRSATPELEALGVEIIPGIDVTDDDAPRKVATALGTRKVHWLVLAAGVLEPNALEPLDVASVRHQFEVNALAPLRFVSELAPFVEAGGKIAVLTSRMGSIADNTSGGHYGYRMSKAALNAAAKSFALDLAPKNVSVAILHPGYVRTRMTHSSGLIGAEESAALLAARIDALTPATSGTFWHANGDVLPW